MPKPKRVVVSRDGHTASSRFRPWILEMDANNPEKIKDGVVGGPHEAMRAVMRDPSIPQRFVIHLRPGRDGFWNAIVTNTRTCIHHNDCEAFDAGGYTGSHPQRHSPARKR